MDYGALIRRSWEIVWRNKWLILLGVLIALGSGGSSGGNANFQLPGGNFPGGPGDRGDFEDLDIPDLSPQEIEELVGVSLAVILSVVCVIALISIVIVVLARIASGAVIAGVDQIESTGASSLSRAWGAGWERAGRLIGIGIIAAIPGLIFLLLLIGAFAIVLLPILAAADNLDEAGGAIIAGASVVVIILITLGCVLSIIGMVLNLLRGMADRAAVLEGTGVIESYRRGWEVLKPNFGQAIVVALIHIGVGIAVGVVMFFVFGAVALSMIPFFIGAAQSENIGLILIPLIAVCGCILIPVILALQGFATAYYFTLWTLAYRQWIGRTGQVSSTTGPSADVAPGV